MSLGSILKNELRKGELLYTPRWELWISKHPELVLDSEIGKWVIEQLNAEPRVRSSTWAMSGVGRCPREHTFTYLGVPQKKSLDSDKHMIFFDGHFRHVKWQSLGLQAGLLDEVEVPVYMEEYNARGTLDAIATHPERGKYGVEFKGANDRNYKWVLNAGPMDNHVLQTHAYMLGTDLDVFSLIYENKNTQEWKEFVVERDPEIINQVIETLEDLQAGVHEQELPQILDKCKEKKGPYPRCPYRHICLEAGTWYEVVEKKIVISRS